MKNRFKIDYIGNKQKIVIHNPFKGWGKFIIVAYFLTIIAACWILLDRVVLDSINHNNFNLILMLVLSAVFLLYFLVLRTIIRNANEFEVLVFDGINLELHKGLGWFRKSDKFNIKDIIGFRYVEDRQKANHPLKTESFDYLGFQTEQKVIDEFYKDDRIIFTYHGKSYSFGKDLMSWEFDELLSILQTSADFDLNQLKK